MKLKIKTKNRLTPKYPHGTTRVVRRFLFFPKTLQGERYWLQWVKIKQQYYAELCRGAELTEDYEWIEQFWINICFINQDEKTVRRLTGI